MQHFSGITQELLPKMVDSESQRLSQTFFKDFAFSTVKGKEMTSGLFRMTAGAPLEYTYTYEEMKYIVEGKFKLTDGTGQTVFAKAGDLVYFPKGCKVTFETPRYALGCFTGQRKVGEEGEDVADESIAAAIAANPAFTVYEGITTQELPKMMDGDSQKLSRTYFKDFAASEVAGKEMTSGLFRMMSGPPLEYEYTYEEMKYIVEGAFRLTDGTGQTVTAKAGDLMYFPKGCKVTFETPRYALGCFTGQRKVGEE